MERVKPGLRACPKPQASWAIGQCAGGASQNAQALEFQIVGKSLVRSRMGLTGLFWVVQLRFHFFLRRACYGAILGEQDDADTSVRRQFHDRHFHQETRLDFPT
jgi:hypothetical protein